MVSLHISPGFVARAWMGAAGILLVALQPASLLADVDLTGDYRVDGEIGFVDVCTASIVQTGSALTYNGLCVGGASYQSATGTIDTVTGEFTLSGVCEFTGTPPVPPQPPGPFVFSGSGSQDSLTFTMNGTCAGIDYIMHGTKCGNGIADANELCEDGNRDDGDCCSSTCTPERT